MSRITQSFRENPRETIRLRQFLLAGILASGSSSLGLLILALYYSSKTVLIYSAASFVLMLLYVWARHQAAQQRIRAAVVNICLGLWSIAILAALVVPFVFPIIALTPVLPIVVALPYVSRGTWFRLIISSTLVSGIISVLSLRNNPFCVDSLPHWLLAGMNGIGVPVTSSLIFLLLWQYRNRLNDILEATQVRQNALQESEQRLAAQVLESQTLAQRSQLFNQLASQIRNSLDLDTILETVVQEIRNLLQIDRCHFAWYRPQAEPPSWEIIKESIEENLPSFLGCYPLDSSPIVQKLMELEMLWTDDVRTLEDVRVREGLIALGVASILSIPIQTASGEIGVVTCIHHRCQRQWCESEVELLQAAALQVAIAINQATLYTESVTHAELAQEQTTQLEQTLHELQRTQAQLIQSEKMSSLGQLVAGVAHEINNPVNFVYGNLSHAEAYIWDLLGLVKLYQNYFQTPPPEIQTQIEAIDLDFLVADLPRLMSSMQAGAERIREIVKSLRTFSRLDETGMKAADIHSGIDSTLMILQSRLNAGLNYPPIEVIKEYGDLPEVECFPGQLNQVFMNLLTNAIDAIADRWSETVCPESNPDQPLAEENHTKNTTDAPCIQISTQITAENRVVIAIRDNGQGISEEVCAQMFNPFFTTKPIGKGTGLGLPICHSIVVEKHKGELECHSTPGQGTEFIIEIPIHHS
jgi:signal transduction histidine kinase